MKSSIVTGLRFVLATLMALGLQACNLRDLVVMAGAGAVVAAVVTNNNWGYSPTHYTGSVYYAGGQYNQVQYAPGYYQQSAPFVQTMYRQPQYGQPVYGQPAYGQPVYAQPQYGQPVYGQPQYGGYGGAVSAVTSGPTLYILNDGSGRLVTRSECDGGSGCQAVIPGAPGPQVVPPVGNYRGVGSIAGVQIAPNGMATAGFIPRPN